MTATPDTLQNHFPAPGNGLTAVVTPDTAAQDARSAEQAASALAERVRDGDTTVTAAQLAAARSEAELALLRSDAARRRARADARGQRLADYRVLAGRAREFADQGSSEISEAFDNALVALRLLWDLTERHDAEFARLHEQARTLAAVAEEHGETAELTAVGVRQVTAWGFATPMTVATPETPPFWFHRRAEAARVVAHTSAVVLHQERARRLAAGARGMDWDPELHLGNYTRACREALPALPDAYDL